MAGFFPDAYPDELFYSVCARYVERIRYGSHTAVMQDLFGVPHAKAIVDFPRRLDAFCSRLPHSHPHTVDHLIDTQTLLPAYAPFLSIDRQAKLRDYLRGAERVSIRFFLSHLLTRIAQPDSLRYCPRCVMEEREQTGECYWHRLHQIPGIELCPQHGVWLEASPIARQHRWNPQAFLAAESVLPQDPASRLVPVNRMNAVLLQLAIDISWLLAQSQLDSDPQGLVHRYRWVLAQQGFGSYSGILRAQKLLHAIMESYPPELLRRFHCLPNGTLRNPLLSLVRGHRSAHHPIHHLLLIQFLGHSAESFWQIPSKPSHFGTGPWPCLNRAVPHYHQPVVRTCEITMTHGGGRPVGTFRCLCGFVYTRRGPDWSSLAQFFVGKVMAYGPIWDRLFKRLWKNPRTTIKEMGRRLGITEETLRRQAARLQLSMPREGPCGTRPYKKPKQWKGYPDPPTRTEILTARRRWVTAKQGRGWTRKTPLQSWLWYHDRPWLLKQRPKSWAKAAIHRSGRIDWDARDREAVAALEAAAKNLLARPGQDVRLTRSRLLQQSGLLNKIHPNLHRLSRTKVRLTDLVESKEAFAIRRFTNHCESNPLAKETTKPGDRPAISP